jgi:ferric-dicitrate binding protein FerR (iron transport regulator)
MVEAFFDVDENPGMPFLVKSRDVVIKALDTSCNVKAFVEDDMIEVVLASGKVEVSRSDSTLITLLPGEEVIYYNNGNSYKKQKADMEKVLAWRENLLIFEKATSEEIFTQLERWYGVEFVVSQEAIREPWRFSGCF